MGSATADTILLVYHHPLRANAPTIMEHVGAFERYSRFPVVRVNTELGFDRQLADAQFGAVVLHYSLFGSRHYMLNDRWYDLLRRHAGAYKIAFFQDEYQFCAQRFDLLNSLGVDCVFTLFEPQWWDQVYRKHTRVPKLVFTLTGYVSDDVVEAATRYARPAEQRGIDVGYRARKLAYCLGRGAQEKWLIAREFIERSRGHGLKLDISWDEGRRIYGPAWYEFLGDCRATLGVESGVSITDLDGSVHAGTQRLMRENPDISFDEMSQRLLAQYENRLPLRTISPRCFEAAAMRTLQIMFEGHYNGIMRPMVHYIPLAKDFSNFDEVLRQFRDRALCDELTENAHRELIESGDYSFRRFIEGFDATLIEAGLQPPPRKDHDAPALRAFARHQEQLHLRARLRGAVLHFGERVLERLNNTSESLPTPWRRRLPALLRRTSGKAAPPSIVPPAGENDSA